MLSSVGNIGLDGNNKAETPRQAMQLRHVNLEDGMVLVATIHSDGDSGYVLGRWRSVMEKAMPDLAPPTVGSQWRRHQNHKVIATHLPSNFQAVEINVGKYSSRTPWQSAGIWMRIRKQASASDSTNNAIGQRCRWICQISADQEGIFGDGVNAGFGLLHINDLERDERNQLPRNPRNQHEMYQCQIRTDKDLEILKKSFDNSAVKVIEGSFQNEKFKFGDRLPLPTEKIGLRQPSFNRPKHTFLTQEWYPGSSFEQSILKIKDEEMASKGVTVNDE
ncbi:uncharacterized protein EV420DRAFT_1478741 [Desarmillaria tabescens]|uniref:Uncharacterized protein n=1 Tax=Armillaria tabescens TaxID=1929756 RepID=A0AA39KFH1_ARMTA|nr:uncharacterized protein EV420DRAFT_1478741 [Desarmillaria tabescens]KAK0460221.1 hypothetical protein EV420DRAFT_1478741 [Desarmillaria tabescens]